MKHVLHFYVYVRISFISISLCYRMQRNEDTEDKIDLFMLLVIDFSLLVPF